ncbi:ABC transporter ATP-binding protein [Candidatus Shapirobacteria bacterium]|nr:ABC transporter ATP-binding protein [Candidatus Shapirobacteria bacterium]
MSSIPLLKLENVFKIYKIDDLPVKALDGVDLVIKKGDFLSVMGPSGSGKSTLMHIAGCLDIPTSGKVILEGENVSSLGEKELAKIRSTKIGFVFQSFNLVPRMEAIDNVQLPLIYAGIKTAERERRATETLIALGLKERLHHFPNQLSGGEQQRVALARALVNRPAIILADEPTGNVDSHTAKEIMEILTKLNKEGNTLIIVTHDPEVAKWTKRIVKIKDGKIEN